MASFECPPCAADSSEDFWRAFNASVSTLRSGVQGLASIASDAAAVKDGLLLYKQQITQLQSYATESTKVLPPYDIRRSQEILESANSELKTMEQQLQPKKKFAFSAKAGKPVSTAPVVSSAKAAAVESAKSDIKSEAELPLGSFVLDTLSDATIFYTDNEVRGQLSARTALDPDAQIGVYMKNLQRCTVTLPLALGSVRMENLSDCTVCLGPVSTSVYIERAERCVLRFACHQLRIHNCTATQLYIHARSHPIIEDCNQMGFAPYDTDYRGLAAQLQTADLAHCESHWDKIVDFRWHKSTASPNWRVIPEPERLPAPAICLPADGFAPVARAEEEEEEL